MILGRQYENSPHAESVFKVKILLANDYFAVTSLRFDLDIVGSQLNHNTYLKNGFKYLSGHRDRIKKANIIE